MKISEFRDRLKNLTKEKSKAQLIRRELNKAGDRLLERVIDNTPVDTGWLQSSWYLTPVIKYGNEWSINCANTCHYAPYVEYGHRTRNGGFVPGVFMFKRAMNRTRKEISKMIEVDIMLWFNEEMGE